MNKQDEEKALNISVKLAKDKEFDCTSLELYQAAMQMAEWKEEQMIEKVVEFIKQNFYSEGHGFPLYYSRFSYTPDDIIRDIKEVLTK